uniref:Uncharacterized protein n=1 Tax=Arundo donax TaxID=35708 RepID=A0A0A9HAB4_ARUDO
MRSPSPTAWKAQRRKRWKWPRRRSTWSSTRGSSISEYPTGTPIVASILEPLR